MNLSNGEGSESDYCIRDGLAASEATGPAYSSRYISGCWPRRWYLREKSTRASPPSRIGLSTSVASGEKSWDAELHRLRGELVPQLPHPDPAKAEDSFRTPLAIAREQGTRGYELRAATSLARLRLVRSPRASTHKT